LRKWESDLHVAARNSSLHPSEICWIKPTDLVLSAVRIQVPSACVYPIPSDS
jgi:hypothetical protein